MTGTGRNLALYLCAVCAAAACTFDPDVGRRWAAAESSDPDTCGEESGDPGACDDGDPCTADSCDEDGNCVHERICCKTEVCTKEQYEGRREIMDAVFAGSGCDHVGFAVLVRDWSRSQGDAGAGGWGDWSTLHEWGNHGRAYESGGTALASETFEFKCCIEEESDMQLPPDVEEANQEEAEARDVLTQSLATIPDEVCEAVCGHHPDGIHYRYPWTNANNGHNSNTDGHHTEERIGEAFGSDQPLQLGDPESEAWCRDNCGYEPGGNQATCNY